MDPRLAVVEQRLAGVDRIVAVTGGKGGTGKSVVASTLALTLAGQGKRTGLLDLDFTGASDQLILGAENGFPTEEFGIDPAPVHGIGFMSVTLFAGGTPVPLRGGDVTNALLELLAITRWRELDYLVIDMPPGLGDVTLDTIRLLPRAEYLAVATDSRVVLGMVRKTLQLHRTLRTRVCGIVENMKRRDGPIVAEFARELDVPYLGALPFDEALEAAIGDPEQLAQTPFAAAVGLLAQALAEDANSS